MNSKASSRTGGQYLPGLKWRANRGQELVIGGYVPASNTFDSLLVGYYEGHDFVYAGCIRAGLVAASRRVLLSHFAGLSTEHCPFRNLPERTKDRWARGLPQKTWPSVAGTRRIWWQRSNFWSGLRNCGCGILGSSVRARTKTRAKSFASRISRIGISGSIFILGLRSVLAHEMLIAERPRAS